MPIGNVSILQKKPDLLLEKGILRIAAEGRPEQELRFKAQAPAPVRKFFLSRAAGFYLFSRNTRAVCVQRLILRSNHSKFFRDDLKPVVVGQPGHKELFPA